MTPYFSKKQLFIYGTFLTLFLVHQIVEKFVVHIEWMDNYLDAFIYPIIVLPLILLEKRIILNDYTYTLSPVLILVYWVLLVCISEFIFPKLSPRFTYDSLDILMITLGTLVYYFSLNSSSKSSRSLEI